MSTFIDPSELTPLFTAQQIVCAYPVSDFYADIPRYLYYSLLVACLLIRWHPWLSDVFLAAAATYAGCAAFEAFILLAGYPKKAASESISIPNINPSSVRGNQTLEALPNLVTGMSELLVQPSVMEYDIDAILAIVVTSYLFMLPVHCWSTRAIGSRARHLLIGIWNILMLCATICALILWTRLANVPYQFRFCYPQYPDLDSIANDGWVSSLWSGSWNSTIWHTFADPAAYNILTENCLYPCFNTSQILRRPQSITASLHTTLSPRTDNNLTDSEWGHQERLSYLMYVAIIVSTVTAVVVLVINLTGAYRFTIIPLRRPSRLWTDRINIKQTFTYDIKNLFRRRKRHKDLPKTEKDTTATFPSSSDLHIKRRKSMTRLVTNTCALGIFLIVVIAIPATWVVFVVWIEWWIHKDFVSQETPNQIGQWAPAVSVGLVLVSALILRLKYRIASDEEVDHEIGELQERIDTLRGLREERC